LLYGDDSKFGVYQIRDGIDEAHNFRFAPMKELEAVGITIDRANYELIYTAPLYQQFFHGFLPDPAGTLAALNEKYTANIRPDDPVSRSVSVSDVVVFQWRGNVSAHFVDSAGFVDVPGFLGEESRGKPEITAPTSAELEAGVQTGKIIPITAAKNTAQPERRPPSSKGRPSLMARLDAGKQKAARQGQAEPSKANQRDV
jgi:hypothetical protein